MNSKVYRCCAVPQCYNTSIKTPNKLFVFVPQKKTIRNKWLKLARRDLTGILPSTHLYFCEDHFDMPNDMENYMEYHLMGSVSQIRMKPGCMPTRYQCQPDRRKRTSVATERSYILKKQRNTLIEECGKDLEERTVATKKVELGETSSGSSAMYRGSERNAVPFSNLPKNTKDDKNQENRLINRHKQKEEMAEKQRELEDLIPEEFDHNSPEGARTIETATIANTHAAVARYGTVLDI